MEIIGIIILYYVASIIWGVIKQGFSGGSSSATEFEFRVIDDHVGDDRLPIWAVQIRGPMPIVRTRKLASMISVFDVSDDEHMPVVGAIEMFQEPGGYAFYNGQNLGICEPSQGYLDWATVGIVPKDLLMYPMSGNRNVCIQLRLVDIDNPPILTNGFVDNQHPGIVLQRQEKLQVQVQRGFLEKSEEELAVAAASIRMAIRLAYADGKFERVEGLTIRDWAKTRRWGRRGFDIHFRAGRND
jgi:hypothetical protein